MEEDPHYHGDTHFSSVITMGDVMDSTLMHINDLSGPYTLPTRLIFQHSTLLK